MPLNSYGESNSQLYSILIMALLAVLGVLMVSTIRYTSFKSTGSGRRNLYLVLVIAAVGMLIWLYSKYVVLILAAIYVLHGVIWHLASLLRPRKKIEAES
jgi:CDP-diacylglycerol--serine O-phosphatidyltransferase